MRAPSTVLLCLLLAGCGGSASERGTNERRDETVRDLELQAYRPKPDIAALQAELAALRLRVEALEARSR